MLRDLPEELTIDILLRLPAKSLIRFRCVCKSWCALLSDPYFIYKNLLYDCDDKKKSPRLLVIRRDRITKYFVFYYLSYDTFEISVAQDLPFPVIYGDYIFEIGGSCCDGFICLRDYQNLVLWNPTTNEMKIVPHFQKHRYFDVATHSHVDAIGFGFDTKTNDCKIVTIIRAISNDYDDDPNNWNYELYKSEMQAEIYSLRKDSWRKLGTILPISYFYHPFSLYHFCQNGTHHWLVRDTGDLIVSFDMSNEAFITTSLLDDSIVGIYNEI